MKPDPYRTRDAISAEERPPSALFYPTTARSEMTSPFVRVTWLALAALGAATLIAAIGHHRLAALTLLVGALYGVWAMRRAPSASGVHFRIEDRVLVVRQSGAEDLRIPLVALRNVSLDSKSIRKVVPGRDAVPAVQFIHSSLAPEIDVSRLVLDVDERRDPVRLTETFLAHMDAVEWAGKIRSFLRANGWVPEDERSDGTEEDVDGDSVAPAVRIVRPPPSGDLGDDALEDDAARHLRSR